MIYRRFKYEILLYLLAFTLALGIRLLHLGSMPLTDAESTPALQALRISQNVDTPIDPQPFYILSTSVLFLLFGGGNNFLARLIPALMGSLLVLAPLLFDDRLRPRPSLLLAFFLALDPGLVAISRQASSTILAIALTVFTAGFINKKNFPLAAILAALTLLTGTPIWLGLLGIGITFAIYQLFIHRTEKLSPFKIQPSILLFFFATFILAGTLFFTTPEGLGAAFSSIPSFINSWTNPSDITQGILTFSLLVYQPFAILLTVLALIRGWMKGSQRIIFLSIWLIVSLLLVIFLPSRQIADLAWTLIPLNALASLELIRHFSIFPEERREVIGVAFLTVFIWVFAWLGLSGMNWTPADSPTYRLRVAMLIGSLFMLVLSLVLVAAGWSIRTARLGGVWGMAIGLGLLGLSGMFGSAGMRGLNSPELWWLPGVPVQADLVRDTVNQVSDLGIGNKNAGSVVVVGMKSPAIEWALRGHPVQMVDELDPSASPDFIITPFDMNLNLASAYRGQDFLWRQTPLWKADMPGGWLRWVTLREMPPSSEVIILWARDDLFFGN